MASSGSYASRVDEQQAAGERPAAGRRHGDLGLAAAGPHDLAVAALAPQLHARLVEEAVAVQPARRELAAVGVERDEPSRAMRSPPSMNGPPSPLPQNPSASSQHSVMKLNPSYSSATSTSAGVRSVRVHSCAAASRNAIVVRSSHWSHDGRPWIAVPTASTCDRRAGGGRPPRRRG